MNREYDENRFWTGSEPRFLPEGKRRYAQIGVAQERALFLGQRGDCRSVRTVCRVFNWTGSS